MRPDHTDRNTGIVAMYAEGRSTLEIGRQIGMSDERVRQILAKAGVERRHRSARPADEAHNDLPADNAGTEPVAANAPERADGLGLAGWRADFSEAGGFGFMPFISPRKGCSKRVKTNDRR